MYSQIRKLSERFGGGEVTLVGDRGMLKRRPVSELQSEGMHYITAITRAQIGKLLKTGIFQPELFDRDIAEVWNEAEGARYVIRRNELQARRALHRREDQLEKVEALVSNRNLYLAEHPRARLETAVKMVREQIRRYKLTPWVSVIGEDRQLRLEIDESARGEAARFDGCYVLKTDLPAERLSGKQVDERYRSLARVERVFRTCKTAHLELRPVYVRLASRTRGHVFVVMLAYFLVSELARLWKNIDLTVEEGIARLRELCVLTVETGGSPVLHELPRPRGLLKTLLDAAGVRLFTSLPAKRNSKHKVDTKGKLRKRRNL